MIILGIETSCDETAAAVVENGAKILSNVVATSAEMHAKTGGIIPEQAARQQIKSILPVIDDALKKSGKRKAEIDTIAVTVGPGLIGSLLVGMETAKALSFLWGKPLVPVNHLAAHIYANWLKDSLKPPKFPALALVVSGGHTDLVLMSDHGKFQWIGGTRDDAAGEAFDKTARLLGLPYPGGPAISNEAEKYLNQSPITNHQSLSLFPRPMIDEKNYDWSFSGLKTSVLRKTEILKNKKTKKLSSENISILAAETQEAIADVLVEKTLRAVNKYRPKSLLLAGGVAANQRLRDKFRLSIGHLSFSIDFRVPPPSLCTDNAAYIAAFANFNYQPVLWKRVSVNPQLTIVGER